MFRKHYAIQAEKSQGENPHKPEDFNELVILYDTAIHSEENLAKAAALKIVDELSRNEEMRIHDYTLISPGLMIGEMTSDVDLYKDAIQKLESHAHDAAKILSLLNEILIRNPSNPFIVVLTNTVDHTNATIELKSTVELDDTFSAINSSDTRVIFLVNNVKIRSNLTKCFESIAEANCRMEKVMTSDINLYKDAIQKLESHAHDAAKVLSLLNEFLIRNPSKPFILLQFINKHIYETLESPVGKLFVYFLKYSVADNLNFAEDKLEEECGRIIHASVAHNSVTVEDGEIYIRTFLVDNLIFNILYQNIFSLKIDIHEDTSEKRNLGVKQPSECNRGDGGDFYNCIPYIEVKNEHFSENIYQKEK
ncbi:hypothetical protein V9T40_001215 [Parthenolecanium corni]|uniref:Uncharacterized protein n=1 Tax=Parthenolecanium corni TaxID=536013 RepID=A0AAN9Y165_9HEMI